MDQDKTFLGTEPVGKLLLKLAVPTVIVQLTLGMNAFIMPQFIADKTTGVYTAEPVADFIAVCFTAVMFSIEFKKAMRALDTEGTESV